jgi:hypothetical protein
MVNARFYIYICIHIYIYCIHVYIYIYNIYCLNQFNLCFWFARKSKKQLVQSQFLVMFLFSSPTSAASNTEVRCKESCAVNMTSTLVSLLHVFLGDHKHQW